MFNVLLKIGRFGYNHTLAFSFGVGLVSALVGALLLYLGISDTMRVHAMWMVVMLLGVFPLFLGYMDFMHNEFKKKIQNK